MTIGEKIRYLRNDKGLTQAQLAAAMNVTEAVVRNYEKGRRYPKIESIKKIADAFDIPYQYFIDDVTTMKIKLSDGAKQPTRAHENDAGLDVYSLETKWVHGGEHESFRTGVSVTLPRNTVGFMTSKSGLMKKGLTSRGTIDEGYTGEIGVILYNHSNEGYLVHQGDKISQLVVVPILKPEIEIVEELEETDRGANGFGSTGK